MREACLAALTPMIAEIGRAFPQAEFEDAIPFLQRVRAYLDQARDKPGA
jgi:hypothetical protein